jgi:hypothetical protein
VALAARTQTTVVTNWTGTCTTVTLGSTNGWDTNFDNLVIDAAGGGAPATSTPTPTPTNTPQPAATSTPTPTPTSTPLPTSTPTPTPTNTPQPNACPCTVFEPNAVPTVQANADNRSVELGMKFRVDQPGRITGVRFYKAATNTGTHTGTLWSSTGQQLATATFVGETASGWQEVSFATPVNVVPGVTYVVSYHAPVGRYSADQTFFAARSVDNGPLHALQNGVDGGNGMYIYSAGTTFPTNTYNSTNYWVDVVFSP